MDRVNHPYISLRLCKNDFTFSLMSYPQKMPEFITLTDGFTLTCAAPSEFPPSVLTAYQALLAEGNAVRPPAAARLLGAYRWAIIQAPGSDQLVSAGALKQTCLNQPYYQTLFSPRKASLMQTFSAGRFPFDLGYLVTASHFQQSGYCGRIMDALLAGCTGKCVLATTQDTGIQHKLLNKAFERRGTHWQADNGGRLGLYLRP
jgi:hypothetical protein